MERLDNMIGSLEELRDNVFPGIEDSDNFQYVLKATQEMRDEAQASFPDISEYGGETPEYATALAGFLGMGTHSDIHSIRREDVIRVVRTLAAYGRDTGHVMCQEYGEDEDWCGIYLEDVYQWMEDYAKDHAIKNEHGQLLVNVDELTDKAEEIIPKEYQTFELM